MPAAVDHLSDILSDWTPVDVHIDDPPKKGIILSAMVPLERHNLARKDIKYQVQLYSPDEIIEVCGDNVSDRHQSVYWRMLRPEFVKGDSETMAVVVRNRRDPRKPSGTLQAMCTQPYRTFDP
ncbi:unnamed protein product [Ectocarpus sp. CCAP 1310/34]|nr:unnamed protein product [Ectocarpus sp. CCAP 1310/34]